jgi:catechol 2,3-dioxygenase-like lactoylglutathione lyase family enzyme
VSIEVRHAAVAIVATSDLDASQAFYERLGFVLSANYPRNGYRIMTDPQGASVHLTFADATWVDPLRNANGIYFYSRDVAELASRFGTTAEAKPWGIREFSVSDPSGVQVRVGWPVGG